MMLDEGYGDGDLALRLTQLKCYLRAVANAILDHRIHCTGMTDDEALDLLMRRAFQSEGEARLKVIRAKQSSVQLSTYFVGRMAVVVCQRPSRNYCSAQSGRTGFHVLIIGKLEHQVLSRGGMGRGEFNWRDQMAHGLGLNRLI